MEALIDKIKQEGRAIHMTVNTPFLMEDPHKLWFIAKGNINIYTVRLVDNEPKGKRFYFFTSNTHQILMGIDSRNSSTNIGFSADATEDSTVYELDLSLWQEWIKREDFRKDITRLVSEWIESLLYGISENANHPNLQPELMVRANDRVILRKGEHISSQRRLVWAKISASKLDAIRLNGIGQISEQSEELLIPVSRRSFLQSTGRNVGMRFYDSATALQQAAGWRGLQALDDMLLNLELSEIELVQAQEQKRLQQRYQNEQHNTRQVLKDTRSILDKTLYNKYQLDNEEAQQADALFRACQIVANAQNIRLKPPPEDFNQSLDPLGDITRASQIRYREVKLEANWWQQDNGAILGFDKSSNTPLALMPLRRGGYEAYNPEEDRTTRVDAQFAEQIEQLGFVLFAPFPAKPLALRDLWQFGFLHSRKDFYLLLLMGFAASILGLINPIMTGIVFDYVIPSASKFQVWQVGFALLMSTFGYLLFEMTESYALLRLETKLDYRLQAALWDRLLSLPAAFFRQFTTGDLAERTLGLGEIRRLLSGMVVSSLLGAIFAFLNFFLLFYYSWQMALVAFLLVTLEFGLMFWIGRQQIRLEKEARKMEGKTQGIVLQLLTGIAKFRVTGTEMRAFSHWLRHFNQVKRYNFEASRWQNLQMGINSITPLLGNIVIFALLFSFADSLSTGEFLAFAAAFGAFTASMLAFSEALLTFFQVLPLYERTKPILTHLPEVDTYKANPGKLKGNIEVSQVNFRYSADSPLVLQDVSLRLNAGDYVAFVGPSGSGKSTLVRLLLGFEQSESGGIFYDDQAIEQLDLRLLRRQIGSVLQEGQLTPGDIFSNIVGASPHLTQEDAWDAARLAAIDEDIKRMPMGMHTVIGEGSSTLSGGQKQRLLIAQTFVHKQRIIIFDEATSALDNRTQAVITQSLNRLQATRIVIAHRLSTIQEVDKIFVFDKGRIVQAGSYDELMRVEGLFKDLAERQMA